MLSMSVLVPVVQSSLLTGDSLFMDVLYLFILLPGDEHMNFLDCYSAAVHVYVDVFFHNLCIDNQ